MNTLETLNLPRNSDSDEVVPLYVSDVIILQDQQFCQIVRLYNNQTVLIRILGTDKPKLVKTSEILINLSYISKKETLYNKKRQMRQSWDENERIEVFSRSGGTWCVGLIIRKFLLRADKRIAHPDMWFQVVYYSATQEKLRYKQLKFDSKHIQKVSDITSGSPFWGVLMDVYEPPATEQISIIPPTPIIGLPDFSRPNDDDDNLTMGGLLMKQHSVDNIHDTELLENAATESTNSKNKHSSSHLAPEPEETIYKQSSLAAEYDDAKSNQVDNDFPALFKQPSLEQGGSEENDAEEKEALTGEPIAMLGMIQRQNSETLPHELSPMMKEGDLLKNKHNIE